MTTRCGYVALLGRPNAGKSTLLNQAVGAKVSIVTPKAQTTRFRISGIVMRGGDQIVLVDTPGIFAPKRRLDRAMVAAAWEGVAGADLACLIVDAAKADPDDLAEPIEALAATGRPRWLILNKIDLLPRDKLLPLAETLARQGGFAEVFMISALKRDGVDRLLDALAAAMPEGPHLYPEDELTDQTERMLAAELVREQIFLQLRDEVPYGASVETESFSERKDDRCGSTLPSMSRVPATRRSCSARAGRASSRSVRGRGGISSASWSGGCTCFSTSRNARAGTRKPRGCAPSA